MSHTASSSTEIGDEVLAKFIAPANHQTLESINSPFTMNPSSRLYRETTKDGEMTVDLDVYKAMTGKEFHGQRIPVHISDDSCEKYNTEATDNGEIFFHSDFDVCQGMDGSELAGQKIPVHISDDKSSKYNIDAVSEDKKITALREEIAFLKQLQETQEIIHKSELVSLQVSVATLQVSLATALSKIETLERQYIAPLQAAVTTLDGENKILRWDYNRRLAEIQANEEAVTEKNDSGSAEGGALGAIDKRDKGVQIKGPAVLLGFFFLLVALFAATHAGSGYIKALEDWAASVGRGLQEMAEAVVDGSWGTLGCQTVDGRHL